MTNFGLPFSAGAIFRSIFEEPTDDTEREDALAGPHGFLIGGMANLSLAQLGQQYFDAANEFVELVRRREVEDYTVSNPIIYLYRHSLELFIKALLPDKGRRARHDLLALADKFEQLVKYEFHAEAPAWIIMRLREVAKVDPDSATFRCNQNSDLIRNGELHAGPLHLQAAMIALNSALAGVIAALECREGRRESISKK